MLEAAPTIAALRCNDCGALDLGPRELCSACSSADLRAHDVPGEGILASWTVIRRAPTRFRGEAPYAVAIVDLSSGLRITGRLSVVPDAFAAGTPVVSVGQHNGVYVFQERSA